MDWRLLRALTRCCGIITYDRNLEVDVKAKEIVARQVDGNLAENVRVRDGHSHVCLGVNTGF